jgi:hypothetical protein
LPFRLLLLRPPPPLLLLLLLLPLLLPTAMLLLVLQWMIHWLAWAVVCNPRLYYLIMPSYSEEESSVHTAASVDVRFDRMMM